MEIPVNVTNVTDPSPTLRDNGTTHACTNAFSKASDYYTVLSDNVVEIVFIGLCVALTLVTVVLYLLELSSKRHRYREPGKRLKTLILLGLYPMTSLMASLALLVPRSTVLVDLFASCFLSLCIYVFMSILIQYFGGFNSMLGILGHDKVSIRTPPCCCCCCCFPLVQLSRRNMYIIKGLIVQVAVVQPLLLFIKAVFWADDATSVTQGGPNSPFLYVNVLSGVSTLLALYALQISVRASREMLAKHRIRVKYIVLQLVLLFINLQDAVFEIFSHFNMPPCYKGQGSRVRGAVFHHMMLTAEMLLLAVVARIVYRKSESRKLSMSQVKKVKQQHNHRQQQQQQQCIYDTVVDKDEDDAKITLQTSETCAELVTNMQEDDISPAVSTHGHEGV